MIEFVSVLKKTTKVAPLLMLCILTPSVGLANGNTKIQSFSKAKKMLENKVYYDHGKTIYCSATFDNKKRVTWPAGFVTQKYIKRAKKVEWEHIVPAENFGRTFSEWRDGHERCVNKKGQSFKGRRCAEKVNNEYRYMQSDLYNLFPAIGAVNAMRSNFNFVALVNSQSDFGSCDMKIHKKKVEPPVESRGRIARTYLYMLDTYKRFKMGKSQVKLMLAWDKMYPVSTWECTRAKRIEVIQGNVNRVMRKRCDRVP